MRPLEPQAPPTAGTPANGKPKPTRTHNISQASASASASASAKHAQHATATAKTTPTLYRNNTPLGAALSRALEELVASEQLPDHVPERLLAAYDASLAKITKRLAALKLPAATLTEATLNSYNMFDDVWTFDLDRCVFSEVGVRTTEPKKIERVRLICADASLFKDLPAWEESRKRTRDQAAGMAPPAVPAGQQNQVWRDAAKASSHGDSAAAAAAPTAKSLALRSTGDDVGLDDLDDSDDEEPAALNVMGEEAAPTMEVTAVRVGAAVGANDAFDEEDDFEEESDEELGGGTLAPRPDTPTDGVDLEDEELNSDDDSVEEEDRPPTVYTNTIVAQFTKVRRFKSKWQVNLCSGVATLRNKRYVFAECKCELVFN